MSGSGNRYVVVPTVTVLQVMKGRLVGATKGHALLKKKADALTVKFRQILKEIYDAKNGLGAAMKDSFFSWTEAKYAAGDNIKHTVLDNVDKACVKIHASQDNIAGVKIPKFESFQEGGESKMELTGLGKGGQQTQNCRKAYIQALDLLVKLANLQTAFITLDVALKTTNRRVNALENVVKPKLENTISYIKSELDELEREEFFRLKKVQKNKQKNAAPAGKAAAEAQITKDPLAALAEAAATSYSATPLDDLFAAVPQQQTGSSMATASLIDTRDDDLLF